MWIGQSAAKPRTEEGSTTILDTRVGTSVPKWRTLNRLYGMVKIWSALQRNLKECNIAPGRSSDPDNYYAFDIIGDYCDRNNK